MTLFTLGRHSGGTGSPKTLDVEALVDTRMLVAASSGYGKSQTLRYIIEQAAKLVQVIVIDPDGDFPSLREAVDMLLVGDEGEVAAEVRTARLLSRKLMEKRISTIVNLYDIGDWDERRAWLAEFVSGLMSLPKDLWQPVLIVVDEAQQFAPQKANERKDSPVYRSRWALASMTSQGRKHGIGTILASQRIGRLDKDAIADLRNVLIGGFNLDIDQRRAADMLGMDRRAAVEAFTGMQPGEFYGYGPALEPRMRSLFTVAQPATTHPKAGQRHMQPVPPAGPLVQELLASLADLPREVQREADELTSLRDTVARLREDLETTRTQRDMAQDARPAMAPEPEIIRLPVFGDGEIDVLVAVADRLVAHQKGYVETYNLYSALRVDLQRGVEALRAAIDTANAAPLAHPLLTGASRTTPERAETTPWDDLAHKSHTDRYPMPDDAGQPATRDDRPPKVRYTRYLPADGNGKSATPGKTTRAQQTIINGLAWLESAGLAPVSRELAAFMAGTSPASSEYGRNLAALIKLEYITYPEPGSVRLAKMGARNAIYPALGPTSQDIQVAVLEKLRPPQARIVRALLRGYPHAVTKERLAQAAETTHLSSEFGRNLARLRKLGVLEYPSPGTVRASNMLYLRRG